MKRVFQWTVAAALVAILSATLAGVGAAQESQQPKAKAAKATEAKKAAVAKKSEQGKPADQAKKQLSAQEAKLQAMRKSVEDLMAKRKAMLQSAEKDAPQVEKITAQIEKITQRAQELRHAAKPAAPQLAGKHAAVAKDDTKVQIARAKIAAEKSSKDASVHVHQILQKHGIDLNQKDANVDVRRGPNGTTIIEVRRAEKGDPAHDKRVADRRAEGEELAQRLGHKREGDQARVNVQRKRVGADQVRGRDEDLYKFPRPQADRTDRPNEQMQRIRIESDRQRDSQVRQNDRFPQSADRPGPMEVTRRLQVLEDRLNSIERKLDQLLQQVSRRGGEPAGSSINRRPGVGANGPGGMPPQMRNEGPPRRVPGPDGPPSDRRPEPGFGNLDGGPPQMRDENDGQDRARRPRNADPRDGREGQRPGGPPPGARELPPPPDNPDAPRRREPTPPPDDPQGPRER